MHARIQAARENESGFTLIELLIVIVILGVLAGIVVFSVSGITNRGQAAACSSDVKTIQVASEAYFAQNSAYAPNMAALVPKYLNSTPTTVAYKTGTPPALTWALAACGKVGGAAS